MDGEIRSPRPSSVWSMRDVRRDSRPSTSAFNSTSASPSMDVQRLEQSAEKLSMSSNIGDEIRKIRQEQKRHDNDSFVRSNSTQQKQRHQASLSRHSSKRTDSMHSQQSEYYRLKSNTNAQRNSTSDPADATPSSRPHTSGSIESGLAIRGRFYEQVGEKPEDMISRNRFSYQTPAEGPVQTHDSHPIDDIEEDNSDQMNDETIINNNDSQEGQIPNNHDGHSSDGAPAESSEAAPVEMRPSRNNSTASKTSRLASSVFKDFDGVHYEPTIIDEPIEETQEDEESAIEQPIPHTTIQRESIMPIIEPPPTDGMVYYPAPVPMMLNLPMRLSQQAPVSYQAHTQRRTQLMSMMQSDPRKSIMPVLGELETEQQPREDAQDNDPQPNSHKSQHKSALFHHRLPPQLRASVFFDTPTAAYEVEIQDGSAVSTLDALLDASAAAPIEPPAYKETSKRKSKAPKRASKNRASAIVPSQDENGYVQPRQRSVQSARNSSYNILEGTNRKHRLSLVGEVDEEVESGHPESTQPMLHSIAEVRSSKDYLGVNLPSHDYISDQGFTHDHGSTVYVEHADQDEEEYEEEEEESDEESDEEQNLTAKAFHPSGAPATLLAELQLRKQELKQRTRVAATAFPNGMHATLLQLDEVAQIEKKRRQMHHTQLAWEDPRDPGLQQEEDDEDIPLGLLYASTEGSTHRRGLSDWDSPLGLLGRKDIEDNEPLSRRRNRLKGIDPPGSHRSQLSMGNESASDHESDIPGETLAQRTRRLKSQKVLNDALGETHSRSVSHDFKTEILSQFGGLDEEESFAGDALSSEKAPAVQAEPEEEETLGQRRARLRAEAASRLNYKDGSQVHLNVPPRQDRSLASLLSNRPSTNIQIGPQNSDITAPLLQSRSQIIHGSTIPTTTTYASRLQSSVNVARQDEVRSQSIPHGSIPNSQAARPSLVNPMTSSAYINSTQNIHAPHGSLDGRQQVDMESAMTTAQRTQIDRWRQGIA